MGVIMMVAMPDDMREITRRFADADQDILKKSPYGIAHGVVRRRRLPRSCGAAVATAAASVPPLLCRPDGQLVSVRIFEVEAAPAGEGKDRFDDLGAGRLEPCLGGGEIIGIENDQG